MLDVRDYDELNNIVGMNRSEDFSDYFEVMNLADQDKEKRIVLAEKLEDNFLFVLAYLFAIQQYGSVDWEAIRIRFESAYRDALEDTIIIDEYLDLYIRQFAYDMVDSTQSHIDDPYYYSHDRARFAAENESNSSWNYADYQVAIQSGKTKKKWVDVRDKRERETHRQVGGTVKPIDEPFVVGGSLMYFPKDTSLGAASSEVINCRCKTIYY